MEKERRLEVESEVDNGSRKTPFVLACMMDLHHEELTEQVFADCVGIVYERDASLQNWKAVCEQGGPSHIQLVQQKTRQIPIVVHRIRGRLQTTNQIVINVVLEKDVSYEVDDGDKSCHHLRCQNNVFLLKVNSESNGHQFAVVVQNILRSLQDNLPSPRQAWMPAYTVKVQPQSVNELLLNSSSIGNKSPLPTQTLFQPQPSLQTQSLHLPQSTFHQQSQSSVLDHRTQHVDQSLSAAASTTSLAPSTRLLFNAQRGTWNHDLEVDSLCDRLSNAISEGNLDTATELIKFMAEQRLSLSVKQKNPKIITVSAGGDSINLKVVVEDRETSGGTFAMKVSPTTTVAQLQEEVAERYGFPPKVQKWISGMKMAKPHETLSDLNIKRTGSVAYLYLVSGKSVGLKRQEFDHYVNIQDERKNAVASMSMEMRTADIPIPTPPSVSSGTQLSMAASLPLLTSTGVSNASSNTASTTHAAGLGIPVAQDAMGTNPNPPAGNPGNPGNPAAQEGLFSASISDIQHMLTTLGHGVVANPPELPRRNVRPNIAVEESKAEPQGWLCTTCTFVNTPTRPGCEMCGTDRPEDYVVPQNPQISEQERMRLEKERQETERFQQTLDRQQQEQEEARKVNFDKIMQAAQQTLISNTEEFDCAICFMTVAPGEGVMLRECLHCFCRDCLREHIRNCTDPEVQCPFQDNDFACHFVITAQEIKALLPQEDFNKFLNRSLVTAESQEANSFHCKTPNCAGWCIYEDNTNVFHCPVCQKANCLTCKAIHHPEMNCKEYQEDLKRRADNDVAASQTQKFLEEMIAKGDAMKCPQCAIILLKKDGCDWMRCSMCRMEICWATRGPRWGPQGVGDLSGGCKCRVGGKKCHSKCRNCH